MEYLKVHTGEAKIASSILSSFGLKIPKKKTPSLPKLAIGYIQLGNHGPLAHAYKNKPSFQDAQLRSSSTLSLWWTGRICCEGISHTAGSAQEALGCCGVHTYVTLQSRDSLLGFNPRQIWGIRYMYVYVVCKLKSEWIKK